MRHVNDYVRKAEQRFSNFNGSKAGYTKPQYVGSGLPAFGFNSSNGGANSNQLSPVDRTLQVTVANDVTTTTGVTLFDTFVDSADTNFTVTIANSSHAQLKNEIGSNPFLIYGMKYNVTTAAQLNNNWTLRYLNTTGANYANTWFPRSRVSAQNESSVDIDVPDFVYPLDGRTSLEFTLIASETVVFTFFLSSKTALANILSGQDVKQSTTLPPPTGHVLADIELNARYGSLG